MVQENLPGFKIPRFQQPDAQAGHPQNLQFAEMFPVIHEAIAQQRLPAIIQELKTLKQSGAQADNDKQRLLLLCLSYAIRDLGTISKSI